MTSLQLAMLVKWDLEPQRRQKASQTGQLWRKEEPQVLVQQKRRSGSRPAMLD
jgi:hypothetical protein